jgi:hypothetical protein
MMGMMMVMMQAYLSMMNTSYAMPQESYTSGITINPNYTEDGFDF